MMIKEFSSIRDFVDRANKPNSCIKCGQAATKEALFEVGGGISLIERYCDACVGTVENRGLA